jgi:UDP-N-acetylmuramate-alanine ligase
MIRRLWRIPLHTLQMAAKRRDIRRANHPDFGAVRQRITGRRARGIFQACSFGNKRAVQPDFAQCASHACAVIFPKILPSNRILAVPANSASAMQRFGIPPKKPACRADAASAFVHFLMRTD